MLVTLPGIVTLVKTTAVIECPPLNAGDAVANRHARQTTAVLEGPAPNAGDAVGDSNAGQSTAGTEGTPPNAGDRFLRIGRANHQLSRGIFITSNNSNRFPLNLVRQWIRIYLIKPAEQQQNRH